MRVPILSLATVTCAPWIAACTTSSDDGTGSSTQEQAIVGVWVGDLGSSQVTLNIVSDNAFKNVTTYAGKIPAVREGTWSVEGDKVISVVFTKQ